MYIALHACKRHMVKESLGITLEPGTWSASFSVSSSCLSLAVVPWRYCLSLCSEGCALGFLFYPVLPWESSLAHLGASQLATAAALSCSSFCFQLTECYPSPAGHHKALAPETHGIVTQRNGQCPKIPWICLILNKFHTLAPVSTEFSGKCRISNFKKLFFAEATHWFQC